ncbi:MAG: hypothetical protein JNK53_06240 [Phycisphaerae bacterium]|nr:hypothetical protein [Phycisphaerae bacterium]
MRWIWLIALALLAAAVAAVVWPTGQPTASTARPDPTASAVLEGPSAPVPAHVPTPIASPAPALASAPSPALAKPPESALAGFLGADPTEAGDITLTAGPAAVVERIDAQSVRLDNRYTVHGTGTERDPYRVTWELLASASPSIDATENRYVLPGRLGGLQDAWIQISGYWAPPLQKFETSEIMVMLNKWDGCCVGLPPTPFDSIEVKLAAPMSIAGQHLFRYGTVRGKLRISPFTAGPYLLGLYSLDQAVLESS